MSKEQEQETHDAGEDARWAELQKETGDQPGEEGEEASSTATAQDESAKKEEPKKAEDKPRLAYEELDKRYRDLQGALGQERGQRKTLAERVQNMQRVFEQIAGERQAAQRPKVPVVDEDPIGYMQHRFGEYEAKIKALEEGHGATAEQIAAEKAQQQFWGVVAAAENEARTKVPDYDQAVDFLKQSRMAELEMMMPADDPGAQQMAEQNGFRSVQDLHAALLARDGAMLAEQALRRGISPAQLYYDIAQKRGYVRNPGLNPGQGQKRDQGGRFAAGRDAGQGDPALAATRAGRKAATTLSGGGGEADDGALTMNDLANLYLEDPDRADKEFARMKKRGQLG